MEHSAVGWTAWRSKRTVSERQTHMATNFTKKTAAIALAAGLAFSGSAGAVFAPVASAQSIDTVNKEKGSITVHKRVGHKQLGAPNADGKEIDAPGTALQGAKFKLQKLVDITDDASFAKAAKLKIEGGVVKSGDETITPQDIAQGAEATTDANGKLTFGNLPAGAYLLTETASPAATDKVYIPAAPMIVYVPVPAGEEGKKTWNRDVHVYPKNTELTTTKTVEDKDRQPVANDVLDYTIKTNAPVMPQGNTLTKFSVNDYYNAEELLEPQVKSVTLGGKALVEGVDYEIIRGAYTAGDKGDANTKVEFKFLKPAEIAASKGAEIEIKIQGKVAKTVKEGKGLKDGEVANHADSEGTTKRTDDTDKDFKTPGTKVVSYFGAVQVVKKGEDGKTLSGAKFELHKVGNGATCDGVKAGDKTKINAGPWTTDANGRFVINNLHVTDLANSTETIDDTYCLVELEAPSGYQKLDKAISFKLTKETVTKPATSQAAGGTTYVYNLSKDVENKKRPQFELPQTGGMGVAALILAGLALLGGGAFAARRKNA